MHKVIFVLLVFSSVSSFAKPLKGASCVMQVHGLFEAWFHLTNRCNFDFEIVDKNSDVNVGSKISISFQDDGGSVGPQTRMSLVPTGEAAQSSFGANSADFLWQFKGLTLFVQCNELDAEVNDVKCGGIMKGETNIVPMIPGKPIFIQCPKEQPCFAQ